MKAATATHTTVTNSYTLTVTLTAEEIAATNAVEIAEGSKTMVDIVAAQDLVTALSNEAKKTELQGKLDVIDSIIVMDEHQLDLALKTSAANIVLGDNILTTGEYYGIAEEGKTIDGGNYTITGSLRIVADNVTLKNITVDLAMVTPGAWTSGSFAVQVYNANDVTLDNVTLKKANVGLYVNSSTVTVNDITTEGNGFGGIGVGKSANVEATITPGLTVTGTNTHNDVANMPHIYEENAVQTWVTATGYTVSVEGATYDGTIVKANQTWYKK